MTRATVLIIDDTESVRALEATEQNYAALSHSPLGAPQFIFMRLGKHVNAKNQLEKICCALFVGMGN